MNRIVLTPKECTSRTYDQGLCHTLGHSDLSWKDFLSVLDAYSIEMIVDVRSLPDINRSSRYRQDSLEEALPHSGRTYLYMGENLGGLPMDQELWLPSGHVNYGLLAKKPYFKSGIVKLSFLCRTNKLIILCSEGDPRKCHRYSLIAPYLISSGIEVHHIFEGQCLIHAQTELFREGLPSML